MLIRIRYPQTIETKHVYGAVLYHWHIGHSHPISCRSISRLDEELRVRVQTRPVQQCSSLLAYDSAPCLVAARSMRSGKRSCAQTCFE